MYVMLHSCQRSRVFGCQQLAFSQLLFSYHEVNGSIHVFGFCVHHHYLLSDLVQSVV